SSAPHCPLLVLQASLRADSRRVPTGGIVTLTCSVDASADWRYYWFKRQTSEYSTSFTIKNGTAEHNITISEEGIYYCRGGRGDPVVFTEDNSPIRTKTCSGFKYHFMGKHLSD
uniref:Ig-like domain-containing protein n=1 Tax=Poecilia reticulata TaxID=8081 RepID=A0A3P9N0S1_POERE